MSVLYSLRCSTCDQRVTYRFTDDSHDGEPLPCRSCGTVCKLEFDGGVTCERTTNQSELSSASLAVMVIMGGPHDIEFLPLVPTIADAATLDDLKARWAGRELRSVGFMGLNGTTPFYAWKEHMEPEQVSTLGSAFLAYLDSFFTKGFAEKMRTTEIDELTSLYSRASASQ
jgi:hypothetical protein